MTTPTPRLPGSQQQLSRLVWAYHPDCYHTRWFCAREAYELERLADELRRRREGQP